MTAERSVNSQSFSCRLALPDLAATAALGARIAAGLRIGDAVALEGDLGAGKTTLARAILFGLGVKEAVPSPTFTIVQSYETPQFPIRHYDFYRLRAESEMNELGFDDALDEGVVLIEWPDYAAKRLPDDKLNVRLSMVQGVRYADVSGSERWQIIEIPNVC